MSEQVVSAAAKSASLLKPGLPCRVAFLPDFKRVALCPLMTQTCMEARDDQLVIFDDLFIELRGCMAVDNALKEEGEEHPSLVTFPHPGEGEGALYLLVPHTCQLFEVCQLTDEPRCWFAAETLVKDGRVLLCTPMDPLLLALPYLLKATRGGRFVSLDDILEDHAFPEVRLLRDFIPRRQWDNICTTKVAGSSTFYRYDQARCLRWLAAKVHRLAGRLQEEGVDVSFGSRAAVLVSSRQRKAAKEDYLQFALGMLSGYLPRAEAVALQGHLGLPSVAALDRSASFPAVASGDGSEGEEGDPPPLKKARSEPLEDYSSCGAATKGASSTGQKGGKKTAAERALGKVDTSGMRTLGAFFRAK